VSAAAGMADIDMTATAAIDTGYWPVLDNAATPNWNGTFTLSREPDMANRFHHRPSSAFTGD